MLTKPTTTATTTVDPDERPVEEVHCTYTGVPIPAIPSWYANVKVKFYSEVAKKNAGIGLPSISDLDSNRLRESAVDGEENEDGEIGEDEIELDDIEIDLEEDTEAIED